MFGDARDFRGEREEACLLCEGLVGQPIPSVLLTGYKGQLLDLADYTARPAVVYVYPGADSSPDGGDNSSVLDAAQHRLYDVLKDGFARLDLKFLGVSSPPWEKLCASYDTDHVRHMLWSDPEFLLAERLGLPTFEDAGLRWYRRLTMVIVKGRIVKVFYPVEVPARDPEKVLDWVEAQAIGAWCASVSADD